jgi:hypothetical protein
LALQKTFMQRLGLNTPAISWTSTRDRYAEWMNNLAMMTSLGDRIGQEIVNLQRPEIGELSEGFVSGAVGSITMPQKRTREFRTPGYLIELSGITPRAAESRPSRNGTAVHEGEWTIILMRDCHQITGLAQAAARACG